MKTIINCNLICLFNRLVSYPIWFSWQLAGRLAVAAGSWHTKTARQESICPSVTLTDDKLSRAGAAGSKTEVVDKGLDPYQPPEVNSKE